ncbi:VWA domain-containing protein [Sphingomonas populi]|uniref:VWA domain-containing protein n=1 Tax=Sphingomonas populi TaxID=2484750 RepID=A0A4Q6Y6F6_9SPHN|nr:VWA domain-containing protein [Sphingomonas populi]RZF65992.1 VWA domain-containing protein [Sphingomonas populi]
MPRMSQVVRRTAVGVALLLVVSCARPGHEAASNSDIVVTSQRVSQADGRAKVADMVPMEPVAPAPPPPPPPPPGMISAPMPIVASRMAMPENYAAPPPYHDIGRDNFTTTAQNAFKVVREEPVSTFSIDVDTASYAFVRASLNRGVLPQPAAVRTEELVNYFPYDYAAPRSAAEPFTSNIVVFPSPWTAGRKLVRIGIKGYALAQATRPRANLVFLIDTSGSMNEPNKLPLVKRSLAMLVDQLGPDDRVAIVTYAGYAGTALEPTPVSQKSRILAVIDGLGAGGGTAGAEGIRQAYALAERNLDPHGVNRVILSTDGDFNIGISNTQELKGYITREREKGVFLSVLGFGMGNYNDALMQALAQNGNGAAAYIDTIGEARKTLVDEATSTLFPIAKDVKIQVEFNPATVAEYRLVGYETRMLNRDDFDNDKVDAGDVGSGQSVTALYEIVPVGGPRAIGDLRYARPASTVAGGSEYGFVKIRYKLPKAQTSRLISTPINHAVEVPRFADAPQDARFATGVATFAELLRGGRYSGTADYDAVLRMAGGARGDDTFGYRAEFLQLVRAAKAAPAAQSLSEQ